MLLASVEIHRDGDTEQNDYCDKQKIGGSVALFHAFCLRFGEHSSDKKNNAENYDQFEKYAHVVPAMA
jgi:hypothetical protein